MYHHRLHALRGHLAHHHGRLTSHGHHRWRLSTWWHHHRLLSSWGHHHWLLAIRRHHHIRLLDRRAIVELTLPSHTRDRDVRVSLWERCIILFVQLVQVLLLLLFQQLLLIFMFFLFDFSLLLHIDLLQLNMSIIIEVSILTTHNWLVCPFTQCLLSLYTQRLFIGRLNHRSASFILFHLFLFLLVFL